MEMKLLRESWEGMMWAVGIAWVIWGAVVTDFAVCMAGLATGQAGSSMKPLLWGCWLPLERVRGAWGQVQGRRNPVTARSSCSFFDAWGPECARRLSSLFPKVTLLGQREGFEQQVGARKLVLAMLTGALICWIHVRLSVQRPVVLRKSYAKCMHKAVRMFIYVLLFPEKFFFAFFPSFSLSSFDSRCNCQTADCSRCRQNKGINILC